MRNRILIRAVPIFIAILVVFFQRCSSEKFVNDAGRTVRLGLKPQEESALGLQAYQQVLRESRTVNSGESYVMVKRCARRLTGATGDAGKNFEWDVSVVQSDQVNAFCLPGGKIVVYTGILPVAETEGGLAVVMGHELAHATLRHGSERILQQQTSNTLLQGVNFSLGADMSYEQRRQIMGLIGAGAQIGFILPFSRDHESEADTVGLRYMARAGYDPREAVNFWQRMGKASKGAPPQFLSTHPAHETRIERLKREMPKAIEIYESSRGR